MSWSTLSLEVITALEQALLLHLDTMTVQVKLHGAICFSYEASHDVELLIWQEIANVMYSLALMSFDYHGVGELVTSNTPLPAVAPAHDDDLRLEALWRIHRAVQRAYMQKDRTQFVRENYDQFAIYFELMYVLQRGRALAKEVYGEMPQPSGPAGTVPSKMHAMTVQAMEQVLQGLSPLFECVNEFNGLHGVFPVDAAVYCDNQLVALVEVDGEFHYKLLGQQLRRKDRLKEFLYRCHYPEVPLYRMRSDQLQVIGYARAGQALANWIYKDGKEKHSFAPEDGYVES